MARRVWFQFVHADGSMMGESADFVEMPTNDVVAVLKKNIMHVYERSLLRGVAPLDLVIFANRVAFAEKRRMAPGDSIEALGVSCEDPLIVQVPAPPRPSLPAPTTRLEVPKPQWKPLPDLTPVHVPALCLWFRLVDHNGVDMTSLNYIELDRDALVTDLQKEVKQENHNKLDRVDASDLVVFANAVAFIERRCMGAADSIAAIEASFGDPVIVQMPASPHPQSRSPPPRMPAPTAPLKPRWKSAPKMEDSLHAQALPLVNFDDAVEQLSDAHESCFLGATFGSRAELWPIKLVDNPIGEVRSAFATQYIQRCIENWPAGRTAPGFRESLCACRTLSVVLKPHALTDTALTFDRKQTTIADALNETVNIALAEALNDELDFPEGTPLPSYLATSSAIADTSFVEAVVEDLGPLFIVLDEIGQGFLSNASNSEEESRDLFLKFCQYVLIPWMDTRGVYFVLMGNAPFLQDIEAWVRYQPKWSSPFTITCMSL